VLRLFGILVLGLVGAGGILFVDFQRVVKEASAAEAPPPSFQTYLETVPTKLASLTEAARPSSPMLDLSQMLPRAPEGWTMRPLEDADLEGFLPRGRETGDPDMVEKVQAAASSQVERGATVAIQAYERGERRVVVQLIRLPDEIFTDPGQSARRYDLQVQAAELRGRPFLTVRGLDVTEELLGDEMRARYFSASVGAQIQVRVLASRRLKDGEIARFFETLNVAAMNAAVIDRQPGLGAVPVLVLGSALSEADLSAYEADRATRAAMAVQRARDLRDMAQAELAADGAKPLSPDCKTESGSINPCSVATGG
jgi:hypothetical protein